MKFYKDLFDPKMEIAQDQSLDKDALRSYSPRSLRYDFPENDFPKSKDLRFCQIHKFGQPRVENYNYNKP